MIYMLNAYIYIYHNSCIFLGGILGESKTLSNFDHSFTKKNMQRQKHTVDQQLHPQLVLLANLQYISMHVYA